MGTGPFGLPTFESLVSTPHELLGLVTKPERRHGRKKAVPNPLRELAEAHGLDILEPDDINSDESVEQLRSLDADVAVVCDYGQILSVNALGVFRRGGINLHGSLLPAYRGAAPVHWAILNGEQQTGVSVIHMTPRLDAGPTLVQRATPIGPDETMEQLEARLAELGVEPVHEALRMLAGWDGRSVLGTVQDPKLATRAPRLRKEDGEIDWSDTAENLRNRVRALQPWPGTFTYWLRPHGDPLRLILTEVTTEPSPAEAEPGTVVVAEQDRLAIATGGGILSLNRVKPAGKREMEIAEFLRGHPVAVGERFGASPA